MCQKLWQTLVKQPSKQSREAGIMIFVRRGGLFPGSLPLSLPGSCTPPAPRAWYYPRFASAWICRVHPGFASTFCHQPARVPCSWLGWERQEQVSVPRKTQKQRPGACLLNLLLTGLQKKANPTTSCSWLESSLDLKVRSQIPSMTCQLPQDTGDSNLSNFLSLQSALHLPQLVPNCVLYLPARWTHLHVPMSCSPSCPGDFVCPLSLSWNSCLPFPPGPSRLISSFWVRLALTWKIISDPRGVFRIYLVCNPRSVSFYPRLVYH